MAEKNDAFQLIRQDKSISVLAKADKRLAKVDDFTGTATIELGDVTITIEKFSDLVGPTTTTHRLFDAAILKLTAEGSRNSKITFRLEDYMVLCGLHDRKEASGRVKADLETLLNTSIEYSAKDGDYFETRLVSAAGIDHNGTVYLCLAENFFEHLKNLKLMQYPKLLFRLNPRTNPNSYYFLRRIAEHKNMNYAKSNSDIISVRTLLESSPGLADRYSEVSKKGRQVTQRIIDPFERDMNALKDVLRWEYTDAFTSDGAADYNSFLKLKVRIRWNNYPERAVKVSRKGGDGEP